MSPPPRHRDQLSRAAAWAGVEVEAPAFELLERFADWLLAEALPEGAIALGDRGRIWERHLVDSVLFAGGWRGRRASPHRIVDLGSGTGLPGIPLGVVWPRTEVVLVDRSARRARLCRRACRVLDLKNVTVMQCDLGEAPTADLVVARGVAPPEALLPTLRRLVRPGGAGVVGGSHRSRPTAAGYETVGIPPSVLDYAVWLLIMAAS